MAVKIDTEACIACGVCADTCPMSALTVNDHAEVDESACVECGACVETCPVGALSV